MKTTRFSVLSVFVLAALAIAASGCGSSADFSPESAAEASAAPSGESAQNITPEEAVRKIAEGMKEDADSVSGAELPQADSNNPAIPGEEIVTESPSDSPEIPSQETVSDPEVVSAPEIEPAGSPDEPLTPGGPASVADQPLKPTDPGNIVLHQPGQELQVNNQLGATKTVEEIQHEKAAIAAGLSTSKSVDETPSSGVRAPILRLNCGQVRLPGCP